MYQTKNTEDDWRSFKVKNNTLSTNISVNNNGPVHITGVIHEPLKSKLLSNPKQIYIQYWAPAPPDFRHSHNGSGLPFPNEDSAYSKNVNTGRVLLGKDGSFVISVKYPNSYYKLLGRILVKPHIKLLIVDDNSNIYSVVYKINLGDRMADRALRMSEKRTGPHFYRN